MLKKKLNMTHLSDQELEFFNRLFESEGVAAEGIEADPSYAKMSVKVNLPDKLNGLLTNAKLTLLAEVGIYQLWFPLEFVNDENGQLTPVLSAPEVIDTRGVERSWRTPDLEIDTEQFHVLSLSSTGVLLKPKLHTPALNKEILLAFDLPNHEHIIISVMPIRTTNKGVAAKIIKVCQGESALRKYLFETHKQHHANLYEHNNIIT